MAGVWRKTLIYLGLVEDDELEDYAYEDLEAEARPSRRQRPGGDPYAARREAVVRPLPTEIPAKFFLVYPRDFDRDAQEVGERFRQGHSVLINLQQADERLRHRMVAFAGGLAYAVGGGIKPAAPGIYLLTPPGVQVAADEPRRFLEESGIFNQA